MPALYKQVKKAAERNDLHSINHRLTGYFELYYDILFAINLEPHPGEKRMYDYAKELKLLPKGFNSNIETIFNTVYRDNETMVKTLMELSINLKELLSQEGYIKL